MRAQHHGNAQYVRPFQWMAWWAPWVSPGAAWNPQLHEGFAAVTGEWQDFLRRRFEEDIHLVQQLAGASAPDQIWNAYFTFWQKALGDYWNEYAALAKLSGTLTHSGLTAIQDTAGALGQAGLPRSKAA